MKYIKRTLYVPLCICYKSSENATVFQSFHENIEEHVDNECRSWEI